MGFQGLGTELKMGDGAGPEVFTKIAKVVEIPEQALSRDSIDTTTFDSDGYKESIPSLMIDPGEFPFVVVWDTEDADHSTLEDRIEDSQPKNYQLTWLGSGSPVVPKTVTFSAFVIAVSKATPIDDRITLNITLKITGKPIRS